MKSNLRLNRIVFLLWTMCVAGSLQAAQLPDFRDIVRQNSPAVVKIIVEQRVGQRGAEQPSPEEIPEYLRKFFEYRGEGPSPRERTGMGSGFIISQDGYIITNNHVVEGASSVLVRMSDRREFEARVIGTDSRSDLALIRVEATRLPVLSLAANDELEVGEWVLAIGSPFGLDYSVTHGIVSAKGRSLPTERNENYVPFIQTDVAINPGNSGGPLFNLKGEVVGVNSQIFSRSGGSIGLSFAIPVSVVRNVVEQLKADGKVTRGWLGVGIQDVDKNLAESFGLKRPQGALISQVSENSPAEKAGLRVGDIIINFDGKEILTSAELPHVVGLISPGTEVDVEIMRDKKSKTLKVKVGGLDAEDKYALSSDGSSETVGNRLGLAVDGLSAEGSERIGISGGVVVRDVRAGSAAEDAGLQKGDVITQLESTPIQSVQSYDKAVKGLQAGSTIPVRLIRRGSPLFIGLKVPEPE